MKPVPIGAQLTREIVIDPPRTIDFLGDALRIYATPEMVWDVENTCRELLLQYCEAGEDSVGTGIQLSHTGATLLGMSVEVKVTVRAVDGRRVTFEAVVRDAVEEVSRGEHGRFVVQDAGRAEGGSGYSRVLSRWLELLSESSRPVGGILPAPPRLTCRAMRARRARLSARHT